LTKFSSSDIISVIIKNVCIKDTHFKKGTIIESRWVVQSDGKILKCITFRVADWKE